MPSDPVLHALRRLTFAPTPALVAEVRSLGFDRWLDQQLSPTTVADADVDRALGGFATVTLSPTALHERLVSAGDHVVLERQAARLLRATWSRRQVQEVMVDLWSDHLNVPGTGGPLRFLTPSFERDVLRPHALGRFEDMLLASARHPAMLVYLDAWHSKAPTPNQNYGRELLELHTIGSPTEADVVGASAVFTGWSLTPDLATFTFRGQTHVTGPKQVAGWSTPGGGMEEGESLLRYLANHRRTAERIAARICRRLVDDNPPAALVASAADVYLRNGTAIAPVVRHIVKSPAFQSAAGRKLRRPFEVVAGALRALDLRYDVATGPVSLRDAVVQLRGMGHAPAAWPAPDGYPDVAAAWADPGALLSRWSFGQDLLGGRVRGLRAQGLRALLGAMPTTAGGLVDALVARMLCRPPTAGERTALLAYLGRAGTEPLTPAACESFSPQLAALVLDSPGFQLR